MFCLSRRANVVESFSDGKFFLQNFHVLSVLDVPQVLGHGKPANLWLRICFYIVGNVRQAWLAARARKVKR
ncbi:hypothetical protein PS662_03333 [Pseudomonas fluorescens]|uniref:Uncharacterized protein n=1 Tax=Pseudomonas fluorescens TaxID=294 RepID=A0A5E6U5K5_PSEFL|nr:hypothetical protein PS662_03333 [Pseudomonas fluorescens]